MTEEAAETQSRCHRFGLSLTVDVRSKQNVRGKKDVARATLDPMQQRDGGKPFAPWLHMHAHTHTQSRAHSHTLTHTHRHTRMHTHTQACRHTHACTDTHRHARTDSHTHPAARA